MQVKGVLGHHEGEEDRGMGGMSSSGATMELGRDG